MTRCVEPNERPFIGSLGDCLEPRANYTPHGYKKITAVEYDELRLHIEPAGEATGLLRKDDISAASGEVAV